MSVQYWRPRKFDWPFLVGTLTAVRNVNPGGKPRLEVDIETIDFPGAHAAHGTVTVELKNKIIRQAFAKAAPMLGSTVQVRIDGMDFKSGDSGVVRQPTSFAVKVIDGPTYDDELSITRWTRLTMEATDGR